MLELGQEHLRQKEQQVSLPAGETGGGILKALHPRDQDWARAGIQGTACTEPKVPGTFCWILRAIGIQ